ncbi:hypothetical protein Ade02nite_83010 [Paractinoplanes deccanensis]|uniref:Uncharacterized protein n=1 Tax=Paractinoplanes deccanensis TaxID=113561 RepID=A0ABQ3YIB0_9ACTN|nr:hypothetical protein [Actinoplanes deccanensis]GID79660.1 hypothetical protein Ade02nite_83010 [Actinoplanes deccanensis]
MTIVEDVRDAAVQAARALAGSKYNADFSPSSLWEVERFFDVEAPGGRPRPGGPLAAHLGARIFAVGSYVGEVVRRHTDGAWIGDDTDPEAEINVMVKMANGTVIWPVQRVMKRYRNGPEDSLVAYGLALGLDVGSAPPPPRRRRWLGR